MEFPPPYGLRLHLQTPHQHRQPSPLPWNFFSEDSPAECFVQVPAGGQDQAPPELRNLLFAPSCDVLELVPGSIPAATHAVVDGTDLLFGIGVEPKSKRPKERDVYENNSQVTFVDYLQPGSLPSGLRLSLGIDRAESSGDSALLPPFFDEIEEDLQQHDVEMGRFIDHEMDQLRQSILEKVHNSRLQGISLAGGRCLHKLLQKDAEIEILYKRNKELEDRAKQLTAEVGAWQQQARENENTIAALQAHLRQACARGDREGCGDSEVDEAASCNVGLNRTRQSMACRVCGVSRACMVLDPCRHLCLCKDCEGELSFCPLCQTSKSKGVEVYLP